MTDRSRRLRTIRALSSLSRQREQELRRLKALLAAADHEWTEIEALMDSGSHTAIYHAGMIVSRRRELSERRRQLSEAIDAERGVLKREERYRDDLEERVRADDDAAEEKRLEETLIARFARSGD